MSKKSDRICTGISLEPAIMDYLDDLSFRMGMHRSWVVNTIVYEYAKLVEKKNLNPLPTREVVLRR